MSVVLARTGRDRQRYENNFRLVSGCIPYRLTKDDDEGLCHRIKVLMVSSPNRNDLVFPKGGWEDDETVVEAACREALEEAGVRGIVREVPLGVWEFRSKSREDLCSLEGGCRGYMFALEVTEELDTWPEQQNRDRKWLNIQEAFRFCRYEWMREALEAFLRVMADVEMIEEAPATATATATAVAAGNVNVMAAAAAGAQMSANCFVDKRSRHAWRTISSLAWLIPAKRMSLR